MQPDPLSRIHPSPLRAVSDHARVLRLARVRSLVAARTTDHPTRLERAHRLQRVERLLVDRPSPPTR